MDLNTYLNFRGNCREAFEFYRSVFGGDFQTMTTFREGPPDMGDMGVAEEERDGVMHVSLPVGDSVLMGSDIPTGFGPPIVEGNNFSVSVSAESREQTDDLFANLSEGGNVTMPLADMFWGDYFGSCTDKFGINWQVGFHGHQEE